MKREENISFRMYATNSRGGNIALVCCLPAIISLSLQKPDVEGGLQYHLKTIQCSRNKAIYKTNRTTVRNSGGGGDGDSLRV